MHKKQGFNETCLRNNMFSNIQNKSPIKLILQVTDRSRIKQYFYKHTYFLVFKHTCKLKILNKRDYNMITSILTLYLSS